MPQPSDFRIQDWLKGLQARGRNSFSLSEVQSNLTNYSVAAVKLALNRLSKKGTIVSIHKGFYIFIPPQYASRGILPPPMFLDHLMKHLERPYYVALLSAAAFHGAAHQQPQEYFVVTNFPVLRPTRRRSLKINYTSIKSFPGQLIEKRKTEAGYMNISSLGLTAADLVQYEKRIGGMNRASTVLKELAETMQASDITSSLVAHSHTTVLQRLGYLLEFECSAKELSDVLYAQITHRHPKIFRIPLQTSSPTKGFSSLNRWKVIVNISIEIDE